MWGSDWVKGIKAFLLKLTVISICILFALNIGLVAAPDQNELSASLYWSTQKIYQGDHVSVAITLMSNSSEALTITQIGIQFDWMAGGFYGLNLSDNPVVIPANGQHVFESMAITIPLDASVGSHSYFIGVDGTEGPSGVDFYWDSPEQTLQITDLNSKLFNELLLNVSDNMEKAVNATYQSDKAQSLLEQAQTDYSQSIMLANEEKWSEALSTLQNASNLLDQAQAAELNAQQNAGQQTMLLYLIVIVVVAVGSAIAVVVRRKRRQTSSVVDEVDQVDQSLET
jgi:heme/copper-type cytochrome/quinol oxidase subunit 2